MSIPINYIITSTLGIRFFCVLPSQDHSFVSVKVIHKLFKCAMKSLKFKSLNIIELGNVFIYTRLED